MSSTKPPVVAIAGVLCAAVTLLAAPQQQQPTFRSTTRTVPVYVTVTDAAGRLVPGLTRDDFAIADNKRPQPLTLFSNEVLPITAVVLLDTSGSMTNYIEFVKQACEQFLLRLLPKDRVMVGDFNDKIQFVTPLIGDRDELISSLRRIDFGYPTHLYDAMDEGVTKLAGIQGRRVIVVFSDGEDEGSHLRVSPVMDRIIREGIMVYGVGLHTQFFNGQRMMEGIPDRVLKRMAEETGGGFFELKKTADLNATFTRVSEELHAQYTLGFSPPELDDKVHLIDVTVKQAGAKARGRKSYVASPDKLGGETDTR
jgi:VWFA-related protein